MMMMMMMMMGDDDAGDAGAGGYMEICKLIWSSFIALDTTHKQN